MKRAFRYVDENSDKVWDIDETPMVGDKFRVEVRWGKTHARKLRSQVKEFLLFTEASTFIAEKISEKLAKGYSDFGFMDEPSKARDVRAAMNEGAAAVGNIDVTGQTQTHPEVKPVQFAATGDKPPESADPEQMKKLRDSLKRGKELFS